jgi:putative Holliday junction resolvase
MGRIIGIDYGRKRIGLAITDPLQIFASPLKTVNNNEIDSFLREYIKTEPVDAFVIGYPVQVNNEPSESVKYLNPFIRKIEKLFPEIKIHLMDERFTSAIALKTIIAGGIRKKGRQDKSLVDRISASIILQSFLDQRPKERKAE